MHRMPTTPAVTRRPSRRRPLIIAGSLIIVGNLGIVAVGPYHPHTEDPNDHPAVFAEYAASTDWIGVHYAQYAAVLIMLAGFVVLYQALTLARRTSVWSTLALGATIVGAAAVTVLQAIDGVALKHAVDAWADAPDQEKAARFFDAEVVRWLEWGANSFFYTTVGIILALFGIAILHTAVVGRWIGVVATVAGVAFVANAVPVSYRGFQATIAGMVAVLLLAVTAIGVLLAGIRAVDPADSGDAGSSADTVTPAAPPRAGRPVLQSGR